MLSTNTEGKLSIMTALAVQDCVCVLAGTRFCMHVGTNLKHGTSTVGTFVNLRTYFHYSNHFKHIFRRQNFVSGLEFCNSVEFSFKDSNLLNT